jgi:hypothetical protein
VRQVAFEASSDQSRPPICGHLLDPRHLRFVFLSESGVK